MGGHEREWKWTKRLKVDREARKVRINEQNSRVVRHGNCGLNDKNRRGRGGTESMDEYDALSPIITTDTVEVHPTKIAPKDECTVAEDEG